MIISDIKVAINALNNGEVVAIPTETVYGLAGHAENSDAIKKIFTLKNRPFSHPLIMHVGKGWDLSQWVISVPDYAHALMEQFWPGPLTLVFHTKPSTISPYLYANNPTIAIRCPSHPITQMLLHELNAPLAAPSANPFGKISPTTSQHVENSFQEELMHAPLLILEGGRCSVGIESTIVSATHSHQYTILRHGTIDEVSIEKALPGLKQVSVHIPTPGRLDTHYQPEKPLFCFESQDLLLEFHKTHRDLYTIFFSETIETYKKSAGLSYQFPNNPNHAAFELYYQLRLADASSAQIIAVELPPNEPRWEAIRERLLKAATKSL